MPHKLLETELANAARDLSKLTTSWVELHQQRRNFVPAVYTKRVRELADQMEQHGQKAELLIQQYNSIRQPNQAEKKARAELAKAIRKNHQVTNKTLRREAVRSAPPVQGYKPVYRPSPVVIGALLVMVAIILVAAYLLLR